MGRKETARSRLIGVPPRCLGRAGAGRQATPREAFGANPNRTVRLYGAGFGWFRSAGTDGDYVRGRSGTVLGDEEASHGSGHGDPGIA